MRYMKLLMLMVLMAAVLCACGSSASGFPDLPDDAMTYNMNSLTADGTAYDMILNDGYTYLPYGSAAADEISSKADACLGYVDQDNGSTDERVYTLKDDAGHNFIVICDSSSDDEVQVWRSMETRGEDIDIPDYIEDLGLAFWQ